MRLIFKRFASTAAQFTPEKPEEIKQLLKPIGVLTKPPLFAQDEKKTFQERKADFLDVKKNRIRREELKEEFARSSFEHIYGFRHTGGKIFTAPPRMFKLEEALYFPNITGKRLDDSLSPESSVCQLLSSDSPNLVRLFSSALGQQQIKQFTENLDLRKLGARLIDVNTPTNWVNRMLVKWSSKSIRKKEVGDNGDIHKYLIADKKLTDSFRKSIAATNELAGYLYVVDKNGKIVWATSGPVISDEQDRMLNVIEDLKRNK